MVAAQNPLVRLLRSPVALLFAFAFALYAGTVHAHMFSDGPRLIAMVRTDFTPYYHLLYIPLGWSLHQVLGPTLGMDTRAVLELVSALSGAGAVALVGALLRRLGHPPAMVLAGGLLFAFTPGVWFFATTVEFHGLQLLGATVALVLALGAREKRPAAALTWVLLAGLAAILTHLSSVLFLPALFLLALNRAPGRGLKWIHVLAGALAGVLVLALLGGGLMLLARWRDPEDRAVISLLPSLVRFASGYIDLLASRGLFSASEVLGYLWAEFVRPAALLLALALLALPSCHARRPWLFWGLLAALVPYLLVLPQSGIREEGAYLVTLMPLFTVAAAELARALEQRWPRRWAAALSTALALVLVQACLGAAFQSAHERGPTEDAWARAVARTSPAGSWVLTTTLARQHALSCQPGSFASRTLALTLDIYPRRGWDGAIASILQEALVQHLHGQELYVDAEILDGPDRTEPMRRFAAALTKSIAGAGGHLERAGEIEGRALLYRVVLPAVR